MFICKKPEKNLRNHDLLLITGDGKTLPADLDKFIALGIPHDSMTIGRSIQLYPGKVTHYVDVDADAGKWVVQHIPQNHPTKGNPLTHTLGDVQWFDVGWDIEGCPWPADDVTWHGSTALFAVIIGLAMGYQKIILAGVPLDSKGHWYFPDQNEGPIWTWQGYQAWFEFAMSPGAGRVKSMSGYTKIILGEPTLKWIMNS